MVVKTDKGNPPDTPPPGAGFATETRVHPRLASWVDWTVPISWVLLTHCVGRAIPPTSIAEDVLKPAPVTVEVSEAVLLQFADL